MPEAGAPPRVRFDSIDGVRGLGALAVVVWHWQHMLLLTGPKFTWPPASGNPDRSIEPFYPLLRTFYEYGFWAVDLFFVISGFIFYLLYRDSIAERRTGARDFFFLRLSRLYPLHLLTLLLVAGMQFVFWRQTQQTFVYFHNDLPHFLENLFLINAPIYSFNGPTWALTVEAVLYAVFWPLARVGALKHWLVTLLLTALGFYMLLLPDWAVWGRGIAGFFAGGLACAIYRNVRGKAAWGIAFALAAVLGWMVTIGLVYTHPVLGAGLSQQANIALHLGLRWAMLYLLFPAMIIALALLDERRAKPIPAFAWLGSISYSAYVIHFPIQLVIALAVVYGLAPRGLALNPIAMIAFFVALALLARGVFVYLEEPIQRWMRAHMVVAKPS